MTFRRLLTSLSACVLPLALPAGAAEPFSLTGTYSGLVACESTTAGEAGTWGIRIELLIVQDGTDLRVDYKYVDTAEYGNEYTLYSGKSAVSKDGAVVSAYFKSCGASFPADELVQMFPSSTTLKPFSFTADSIWVSDQVPNLPGLTVQSCRWSLNRTSTETPRIRACPAE